jgi:hypothetical protein
VEAGDDAGEAGARAAREPVQLAVRGGIGGDELAVGRDDLDRVDAEAGGSPGAEVPTEAAGEQVAAESDARAVPDWKGEALGASVAASCRPRTAGCTAAVRASPSISTAASVERSRSRPSSRTDAPNQLCPPERTASFNSRERAKRTAAATSSVERATTISSGSRSGLRAFQTAAWRACS